MALALGAKKEAGRWLCLFCFHRAFLLFLFFFSLAHSELSPCGCVYNWASLSSGKIPIVHENIGKTLEVFRGSCTLPSVMWWYSHIFESPFWLGSFCPLLHLHFSGNLILCVSLFQAVFYSSLFLCQRLHCLLV